MLRAGQPQSRDCRAGGYWPSWHSVHPNTRDLRHKLRRDADWFGVNKRSLARIGCCPLADSRLAFYYLPSGWCSSDRQWSSLIVVVVIVVVVVVAAPVVVADDDHHHHVPALLSLPLSSSSMSPLLRFHVRIVFRQVQDHQGRHIPPRRLGADHNRGRRHP